MRADKEHRKNILSHILLITIVILVATDVVVVGVLLTLWTSAGKIFNEMKTQLAYIQDTNSIIQSEVSNMESNIEATLEAENSMLEAYSIDVTGYDFTEGTYDVEISVLPKEYTDTTQAIIYFGTQECHLTLNGLVYEGGATLPLSTSYDGNVTVLFMDGNKKTTEVLQGYTGFQNSIEGLVSGGIGQNPSYVDGEFSLTAKVDYILEGNSNYEFETFEFIVAAGGEELYYYDLMEDAEHYSGEYLLDVEASNEQDHMNPEEEVQVASAEKIPSEETLDDIEADAIGADAIEAADTAEEDIGVEDTGVEDTGVENAGVENAGVEDESTNQEFIERATIHSAIRSLSGEIAVNVRCEVAPSRKVHVFLRAITTTGLIIEYDLFNGYTRANGEDFQFSENYNRDNYILYDRKGGRWVP